MEDVGSRQVETAKIEEELGRKLPPSAREWWVHKMYDMRKAGFRTSLFPEGINSYASWCNEQQSLMLGGRPVGIRYSDLQELDPPVYSRRSGFLLSEEEAIREADTVTQFMFQEIEPFAIKHEAGSLWVLVTDPDRLSQQFRSVVSSSVRIGNCDILELDNLVATLKPLEGLEGTGRSQERFRLRVVTSEPISREQIPAFLWEYVPERGGTGVFAAP